MPVQCVSVGINSDADIYRTLQNGIPDIDIIILTLVYKLEFTYFIHKEYCLGNFQDNKFAWNCSFWRFM